MDGVIAGAQVMGWIFETTISTPTTMYGFLGQKGLLAHYRQFFSMVCSAPLNLIHNIFANVKVW